MFIDQQGHHAMRRWVMERLRAIIRRRAMRDGKNVRLFRRFCRPDSYEYGEFLRRHGGFAGIGERCSIRPSTLFTDPAYTRLRRNVHFATCTIVGHDGSAGMLEAQYGTPLDGTGPVDIRDNVFIGHQAIIMPGVTIGPDAIVAAGAVVVRDVAPGTVVGGVSAREIAKTRDVYERKLADTRQKPWAGLIDARTEATFLQYEQQLVRARAAAYFPDDGETI